MWLAPNAGSHGSMVADPRITAKLGISPLFRERLLAENIEAY